MTGYLAATVAEAARRFGDRPALVPADGAPVSYRELDRRSDQAAAAFVARGVRAGDVVVLTLPAGTDYVLSYLGLAKLGAVTAGMNPRLAPTERAAVVEVAEPRLVVATDELAEGLPDDLDVVTDAEAFLAGPSRPGPEFPSKEGLMPEAEGPVAIVFTSGTTGVPKGAVFTDTHLAAVTAIDLGGERWGGGGPVLVATSLAHVGFMTKLPWYLRSGCTLHVLPRWRAADALRLVSGHRMTSVGGVAPQIALMLRQPDFDDHDLTAVETIVVGGGPSSPALVEEARLRFQAAYSIRYSSTESGGVGTGTAFDADDIEALHTVGRPRAGVEVEIRNDDDRPVAPGEVGQVCLRSAAVMAGYWHDPAATTAALDGGWLRTGDLGRLDPSGCLRLAGRRREMYIRGGENVYPMEVEAVLASHPGVAAVAVVPRPDPVMGEVGVAVVVATDPARPPTHDDLRHHAAGRLARYKLPEGLAVVDHLPLTAMEKVDRRALAATLADTLAADGLRHGEAAQVGEAPAAAS